MLTGVMRSATNHTLAKTKSENINKALPPWARHCWKCHQQNVREIRQKYKAREKDTKAQVGVLYTFQSSDDRAA
jgi:ribosomal protein L40E